MLAYTPLNNQPCAKPVVINELVQHSNHVNIDHILLPMLAAISQRNSWLVMLEPPKSLNKAVLRNAGVDINKVWILRHDDRHGINNLAKRALLSGTCHTLICWHNSPEDDKWVEPLKNTYVSSETQCLLVRTKHL